jgi:hypothetical protein
MSGVIDALFPLPTLVITLLVWGFAPGAVLRVIVLAFPREDPRRKELRAELYAVPRWEKPIWVTEQIEVALAEGLWPRMVWAATGRIIYRWRLGSGVKSHEEHPETFWIPSEQEKNSVEPGFDVQLSFLAGQGGERMWVKVTEVTGNKLVGELGNEPVGIPRLEWGKKIKFRREHILNIHPPDWEKPEDKEGEYAPLCECCFHTRNRPE